GNRDNMFDGVMDGVLRDDIPGQSNNLQVNNDGVDIDRYDVSPLMTGYRDNNPDINDVYIKVYSNNDYITPSMFAFSAELYKPNICYDYSVRNDNYTLPSQNREIKTLGNGKLHLNISIRSLEGDFDLQNTTLALDVNPSNKVSFDKALYSKTGTNVMVPAIVTNASKPEIAFGKDVNASGGTLGAFETYFSRFDFDFTSSDYFDGYFDIDLIGYIDFGSGPAPLPLSTKSGTLPRCEQNPVYNPEWGMFNIERLDSGNFNTDRERFPLFTQIAGRDFDFSLVAYDPTDLRHEKTISGYTVDVELIDASPYDDNNSIFTCQNTDPSIIHSNSIFIQFPDSQSKSRINMQDSNDMRINSALKNAAYRMWVLVDENNTIIPHTCTIDDDDCFINTVYQPHLQASDSEGNCANCKSYVNAERGVSGCYACLRDFFGKPYCSRDNFSIRPESYRIAVIDADEHNESSAPKIQIANNNNPTGAILAAEYDYRLEANATTFNSDNIALNYYQELNSTLEFNDLSSCNDTNDSNITYEFRNGQVLYDWKNQLPYNLSHNNVGNYRFHIIDSTWTKVDQKTYRYKRFYSDDCNLGDASTSSDGNTLSGCNTASNFDATHREMNLNFNPYTYDVKGIIISMPNNNNFVYMNDLNTTNIPDRAMAVRFNGPLVARGKSGTQLTNYTASCAAKPVIFDINRTITQNSSPVDKNTIMSIDPDGYLPPEKTSLQRYNSSQDTNTSLSYSKDNNDTNSTFAIRIDSTQFKNENNGSANISLEYNFERKANLVSNPLAVTFNFKEANSTAASSNAHMIANYIPEGNATVNSTVNFIYGRIAASQNTPYIVTPSESQTTIPMFVEGYCSGLAMDGTIMNCALYDLNISSPRDNGQWWVNTKHDSTKGDGQIGSLTDARQGSALSITPNSNIDLNNPTNITVSLPNNIQRPYNTTIVVVPSVPWLGYNPNGVFNPIVNFQGGGGWAGKGNTGMVLDTNASYNPNSKRIEW
ncbi:hypothetical protein, partial [Sulfurovum sp.]|uniref:hypothetical protein n=1 Tax=Sulfurovum sp. TaxID=1969726 RepID=UPI0025E984DE